jgi:hypothetical protein
MKNLLAEKEELPEEMDGQKRLHPLFPWTLPVKPKQLKFFHSEVCEGNKYFCNYIVMGATAAAQSFS